jgi:2-methylcitrate dehydratase
MDNTTRTLAEYVTRLRYDRLEPNTIREAKKRLIDSIGCGLGGFDSEPATIARRLASKSSADPVAHVLGTGAPTSMEMAAFTNSIMVRYLDFNDTYVSVGSGHPSDMTAGCLAVADALNADGKQTLLAIIAAYEVYTGLADQVALRGLGWDQGVFAVLGTAAGAGLLLGLNVDQLGDALAIAITASVPTRQTRSGELAMWKGCATAAAVRSGVFAALLAHAGITGPTAAFEGRHGVWEQVTGKFTLGALGGEGRPFGIERTNLKFFPSEYHSQAPMWMALNLRKQVRVEDIDAINVQTYHICYSEIGSEPEKWQPKTRETADHSLPYLLSLGLMDGAIRVDSFSAARMRDPATLALMQKIKIAESAEFTRQFPGALITEIEVLTRQGARLVERASYPRGHAKNPMTEEDIESKFKILADNVMKPGARDALLAALWSVDQAAQIGRVLELVRVER